MCIILQTPLPNAMPCTIRVGMYARRLPYRRSPAQCTKEANDVCKKAIPNTGPILVFCDKRNSPPLLAKRNSIKEPRLTPTPHPAQTSPSRSRSTAYHSLSAHTSAERYHCFGSPPVAAPTRLYVLSGKGPDVEDPA